MRDGIEAENEWYEAVLKTCAEVSPALLELIDDPDRDSIIDVRMETLQRERMALEAVQSHFRLRDSGTNGVKVRKNVRDRHYTLMWFLVKNFPAVHERLIGEEN
jgi:hypothetical protein